jgi:hypothetical protein
MMLADAFVMVSLSQNSDSGAMVRAAARWGINIIGPSCQPRTLSHACIVRIDHRGCIALRFGAVLAS